MPAVENSWDLLQPQHVGRIHCTVVERNCAGNLWARAGLGLLHQHVSISAVFSLGCCSVVVPPLRALVCPNTSTGLGGQTFSVVIRIIWISSVYLLLLFKNGSHALQESPGNWVDCVKGEMVPVVGHWPEEVLPNLFRERISGFALAKEVPSTCSAQSWERGIFWHGVAVYPWPSCFMLDLLFSPSL